MADIFRIGPCQVMVASSITEPVENWVDLGVTRGDVRARVKISIATAAIDQTSGAPRSDTVHRVGAMDEVTAPLLDKALANLARTFPGSSILTASARTALGLGVTGKATITPIAIALVPVDEYVAATPWWASDYTVWIPSGVAKVGGDLVSQLPDGDDAHAGSAREVQFTSVRTMLGLPASVQGLGGIGQLWFAGMPALGLDLVLEHATADTASTPLIGGAGTFARSTTAVEKSRSDGKYRSVAINVLRDEAQGWLLEKQRSNKCQRNYLHAGAITGWTKTGDAAATLTAVLDATELASAGLDVLCSDSYVLKLDNSLGVTVATASNSGTTGNTNKHAVSAFMRGSGNAKVRGTGADNVAFALTAAYVRKSDVMTPASSGMSLAIEAGVGAVVYFVLAQMEEAESLTSPILNNTAGSVTRNADDWAFANTTAIDTVNGISAQVAFVPSVAEGVAEGERVVFSIGRTTTGFNSLGISSLTSGAISIRATDGAGGSVDASLNGEVYAVGAGTEMSLSWNPALAARWLAYQNDAVVTPLTSGAAVTFPAGVWSDSVIRVGGRTGGSSALNGHIKRLVVARGVRIPALLRQLKRT